MQLRQVGLVHQLEVSVLLVDVVGLHAIRGILFVQRAVGHQRHVRAFRGIEDERVLHVKLVSLCLYTYVI